eukprot:m.872313 g.872313  ORF g.872313 m.872313 type:complete len:392 (-) comp59775_c1_seq14:922-2097(-)
MADGWCSDLGEEDEEDEVVQEYAELLCQESDSLFQARLESSQRPAARTRRHHSKPTRPPVHHPLAPSIAQRTHPRGPQLVPDHDRLDPPARRLPEVENVKRLQQEAAEELDDQVMSRWLETFEHAHPSPTAAAVQPNVRPGPAPQPLVPMRSTSTLFGSESSDRAFESQDGHTFQSYSSLPLAESSEDLAALLENDEAMESSPPAAPYAEFVLEDAPLLRQPAGLPLLEPHSFEDLRSFFGLPLQVKDLFERCRKIADLYDWQKECLAMEAAHPLSNLIYSLPTSGGKTLVAEIIILRTLLCVRKHVIFVFPFVSIVEEKAAAFQEFAKHLRMPIDSSRSSSGIIPPSALFWFLILSFVARLPRRNLRGSQRQSTSCPSPRQTIQPVHCYH